MSKKKRHLSFYLEASLSGLAKWLRFLGYEAILEKGKITPDKIITYKDKIFLITSLVTAELLEKAGLRYLLLPRESLSAQLFFLIHKLGLKAELSLDICTICGERLLPAKKEEFHDRIPPKVWKRYRDFNYCPRCDKLYWEGDHIKRIKRKFRKLIKT
ncbi:MAG: Mut7-C RNAse domain-containing protein [Caldimicrobium sp.]|nr:Mut7-C RNAse domain-containing protein [Caldimicrobium sp.]MCX7612886.1 Mut7-C RNAse domain-containing protein [Caldimicrobium sp.]MDW8183586.1 Mut7-C RNAse domain-containing protein [Caldimicrobium sp.]